jgi:hypothetical protein
LETAAAVKKPIGDVGFEFMTDPLTREAGRAAGLRGRPLYFLGRGGALGDVPAEVVVAAFAFFPPEAVTEHWNAGRQVMAPLDAAVLYAGQCNAWGRRHYADSPDAARVLALLERVVDEVDPAALPLFAAWRLLPRPDDVPGRLAQVMNVLREHRGGVHACAVAAVGLHPLEATLAGAYGEAGAQFAGWPEPWPAAEPHKAAWEQAEELTSAATAIPYAVLDEAERADLVATLPSLRLPA